MENLKIFVFGTFRDIEAEEATKISDACFQMGKIIAERGHTLIAITSKEDAVDKHFIRGINSLNKKSEVIICKSNDTKHQFENLNLDNVKFRFKRNQGTLTNTHIYAMKHADVVLTIAGNHDLDPQIGYSTIAMEKPMLSIPSFGYSAEEVYIILLEQYYKKPCNLNDDEISNLLEPWDDESALNNIKILEKLYENHPFKSNLFRTQLFLSVISLILIVSWIFLFMYPQYCFSKNELTLFSLLGISASIGTATRNFTKIITGDYVKFNFQQLWNEFVAGLLIAFCFILAYFTIGYIFTGDFVDVSELKDFKRISLTMSLLAISTTFLIEGAISKLQEKLSKSLSS